MVRFFEQKISELLNTEVDSIFDLDHARAGALVCCPKFAMLEVPEQYGDPAIKTLAACREIRAVVPDCKILVLCPERDSEGTDLCIKAKEQGEINDFLFYRATTDQMLTKIEAINSE